MIDHVRRISRLTLRAYKPCRPLVLFLIRIPLPCVSVIRWPKCFQTNDLYDCGGLVKLPRNISLHAMLTGFDLG